MDKSFDLRTAVAANVYGESPVKVNCLNPAHQDDTASMAVYRDHCHCYGCGFHRNDADEALSLLLGITVAEAREISPRFVSELREEAVEETVELPPLPSEYADVYHDILFSVRKERLRWFRARGITHPTLRRARIGHTGTSFVIPVFGVGGVLRTLRYRRDNDVAGDGGPKYRGLKGRNQLYLYGANFLEEDERDWVVICEGELDALRLWQDGIPAVSATNGAGQSHRVPLLLRRLCPTYQKVLVALDTDAAGTQAAEVVCKVARSLGYAVTRLSWLEDSKDVTEYLQGGGTFEGMIKSDYCPFDAGRWAASVPTDVSDSGREPDGQA